MLAHAYPESNRIPFLPDAFTLLREIKVLDTAFLFVIAYLRCHLPTMQTTIPKKKGRKASMNHSVDTMLDVSIRDLPAVHVAYVDYQASAEQGDFHDGIRACFQRVQSWVRGLGHEPYRLLNVGIPKVDGGQLQSYGCCVQILRGCRAARMVSISKIWPAGDML